MDDKTQADEKQLLDLLEAMILKGKDGVEAGFATTEFWLTVLALVVDLGGPHYGFLQGIDANEQGLIAMALVLGWGIVRSWRKRGSPASAITEALPWLGAQPVLGGPEPPAAAPEPAPAA